MDSKSPLLNEKQAAQYLGLSPRALQMRRFRRQLPAYINLRRTIRYRREDLDEFILSNRIDPTT
jgi:predicted DNA-binding transcriptional regulator AlpA